MSMEATWDLYAQFSPRSLCVFPVPASFGSTTSSSSSSAAAAAAAAAVVANTPASTRTSNAIAVVYGTDRGSLHYRCYRSTQSAVRSSGFGGGSNSIPSSSSSSAVAAATAPSSTGGSGSGGNQAQRIVAPLGMGQQQQQQQQQQQRGGVTNPNSTGAGVTLPRSLYPVDLAASGLPGPVVSCLWVNGPGVVVKSTSPLLAPLFLVLCDDPRGSSATQPGAYSAFWVLLQHGTFQVLSNSNNTNTNNNNTGSTIGGGGGGGSLGSGNTNISTNKSPLALPRLSAVTAAYGRVYATAGRSVFTLRVPTQALTSATTETRTGGGGSGTPKPLVKSLVRLHFGPRVWPGPVRCGPDALAVVGQGRVVVGCVGHAFYAVAGQEIHRGEDDDDDDDGGGDDETGGDAYNNALHFIPPPTPASATGGTPGAGINSSSAESSNNNQDNVVKLVHWTQSSQVHPVVALDLGDISLETDWSSVFLANGRECAVVDLYYGPASQPRLSTSHKPRNGIVTTASPILAAAASWPLVVILMSDGLCSVRSPSCLAVSLRTVEIGTRPNDFFTLRPVLLAQTMRAGATTGVTRTLLWGDAGSPGNAQSSSSSSLSSSSWSLPWIVGISYAGEAKVLQCRPDTAQDLADRLMRHAIDAFGGNGFPRTDLAKAVQASFTATSYVGPEASHQARMLLKEYLEAVLGLCDWESGASSGWPTQDMTHVSSSGHRVTLHSTLAAADGEGGGFQGKWSVDMNDNEGIATNDRHLFATVLTAAQPSSLLAHTALLCLVASQLSPPAAHLASRAAKACAAAMGVVLSTHMDEAAVSVGQQVTDQLLRESSQAFSLVGHSSSITTKTPTIPRIHRPAQVSTDYIEASIWMLRSCGQHERAMEVAAERLQQNPSPENSTTGRAGQWSRIKYESYTATHLSELWCCGQDDARELVLRSAAAHALLESNPRLGLSVFTALHPQNESQWREMSPRDDPFRSTDYVYRVVTLLKSIRPKVPSYDNLHSNSHEENSEDAQNHSLPLESGRALAVTFLESAMGLSTGRPVDTGYSPDRLMSFELSNAASSDEHDEVVANFHDDLALMLLEGVISERSDESDQDTDLGFIYRSKLRHLLRWPLAKIRPELFMESLPPSFLPEKALVLGRLGRHEDALRILYRDLKSLDMALEYCDDRYQRQESLMEKQQRAKQFASPDSLYSDRDFASPTHGASGEDNSYLPLVRVALESEDTEKGCAAAIQVLALRRTAIDRAAALRLLPPDIPVSAVARPFLIPALVDSESQVRRLTVVSALLRARYLRLKEQLTSAQLKAQANLQVVPQLRSLNLGDPLHSTKPFRARNSGGGASSNMPEVWIVKHFFPRHLVIQARVTNQAGLSDTAGRTLTDIAFVVAESSEEAIQPLLQVPIAVLPSSMTGSTWCVLSAAPTRMEGSTAQLTCELRYTVNQGDVMALAGSSQTSAPGMMGRTFVEELQDLEVHASHF